MHKKCRDYESNKRNKWKKSLPNLPLHKFVGVAVRFSLAAPRHIPCTVAPSGVVRRAVAGVELPCGCSPFPVGLPLCSFLRLFRLSLS